MSIEVDAEHRRSVGEALLGATRIAALEHVAREAQVVWDDDLGVWFPALGSALDALKETER